jgi:tetratricopeptide (TPR) repeat protein
MTSDTKFRRLLHLLPLALVVCLAGPGVDPARAAGGGSDTNSNAQRCGKGEYFSDRTGKCEKLQAGVLPDKDLAQYAVALSKARRYDDALDVLNTMKDPAAAPSLLPNADIAEYALVLAKAKRYDEALKALNLVKNPNTAVALNYRGYITRHLGRVDEGIGYYLKSVSLDPRYAQVREYLGEAYVIKGDVVKAKYQLGKIKAICGNTECEEYEDLEKAIAGHPEDD